MTGMFVHSNCKICLLAAEFAITHQPESFSQTLPHSLCFYLHLQHRNLQFYPSHNFPFYMPKTDKKKVLENFSLEKETHATSQFVHRSHTHSFAQALSREKKFFFYCIYDFTNRLEYEAKCVTQHLNADSFCTNNQCLRLSDKKNPSIFFFVVVDIDSYFSDDEKRAKKDPTTTAQMGKKKKNTSTHVFGSSVHYQAFDVDFVWHAFRSRPFFIDSTKRHKSHMNSLLPLLFVL